MYGSNCQCFSCFLFISDNSNNYPFYRFFSVIAAALKTSESPEVPKGTFRDCKQSPRSRASPDFGSLPIQKNRPYRSRNKDGYFRGTTLIHRIAEHRRFQSHSGTITYTTPSQPTHHLPFYIRGNGFSCTAGQTSFQCEAPGCIHRFVSRASHQPAAFCHHVHLLLLPFKAYIL